MKEKKFKKEKYLLAIAISIINFVFIYFIFVNLKAVIIEQKIDLKKVPSVKLEKIDFYKRNIYLLNNLISLIPQNAEYLIKKADCLRMAMDDGFKELFSIQDKEIEELYQKAIFLNPLNFEYHLKLGWFYIDKDTNKAKKEFLSSIELNPTDFHPYLYFSIYHLKNKDGKQAFINIISALYFKASPQKIIEEVIPQIKDDLNLVFDDKKRELKFVAFPKEEIWDFKKEGFPQIKIPINIRVY
ncbi:MAG: hypothetical protein QXZ20_03260, partial [Candidatus Aenigmatarchaeota archaeon]